MKEITMRTGRKILIKPETYEKLKTQELKGCIHIREVDEVINFSDVSSISDPELTPYWAGYKLNKDKSKVFREGSWKEFDHRKARNITYKDSQGNEYNSPVIKT